MAYSAMVRQLLLSAPSDITTDDIALVTNSVYRWNALYGRQFGAVVIPTHWTSNVAPEHGVRPQESINSQLVDNADAVLALFWHRLGSPTGKDKSGTIEEINRAVDEGKYVGVLRCTRSYPSNVDTEQLSRLREAFDDFSQRSLYLTYDNEPDLARHVDTFLTYFVTRDRSEVELQIQPQPTAASIWPRVESTENVKTDSKGRIKTDRRWKLVLSNTGTAPGRQVRLKVEPEREGERAPLVVDDDRAIEVLAPGGEASYPVLVDMGSAGQVRCTVTWEDERGPQENIATVRFY